MAPNGIACRRCAAEIPAGIVLDARSLLDRRCGACGHRALYPPSAVAPRAE